MFDRVLNMPLFKKSTEKPIGSIRYVSRDYSKPLLGATIAYNPVCMQAIALKNVLIRIVEHDICLGVQAKKDPFIKNNTKYTPMPLTSRVDPG